MGISNSAIIVIVLVGCLAVTALGAALYAHRSPSDHDAQAYNGTYEQSQYMRTVRLRNYGHLKRESLIGKDVESRCTLRWSYFSTWWPLLIDDLLRYRGGAIELPTIWPGERYPFNESLIKEMNIYEGELYRWMAGLSISQGRNGLASDLAGPRSRFATDFLCSQRAAYTVAKPSNVSGWI